MDRSRVCGLPVVADGVEVHVGRIQALNAVFKPWRPQTLLGCTAPASGKGIGRPHLKIVNSWGVATLGSNFQQRADLAG